jgi:hypothetical protein
VIGAMRSAARGAGIEPQPGAPSRVLAIGTDEAGFGPYVGPLTLAGVAMEAPAWIDCGRLWDALAGAVCAAAPAARATGAPPSPLVVCDSKLAFTQDGGERAALATLERTVLSFLSLDGVGDGAGAGGGGAAPATFGAFLRRLGAPGIEELAAAAPWAGSADLPLPVAAPPAAVTALRQGLAQCGVRIVAVRLRFLDAPVYNNRLNACRSNKNRLLVEETIELLKSLIDAAPGLPLRATCGRLGGRKFYGSALGALGPVLVSTIAERKHHSRYALAGSLDGEVDFRVDADADHFLVALASMFAKYAREVYMLALNEWLARLRPGLVPTAGYGPDGRRFIRDCKSALEKAGIPLAALARKH